MPLACELKYCECCGALLVRRTQSPESYCPRCRGLLMAPDLSLSALRIQLESRKARGRRSTSLAAMPSQAGLAFQEAS